MTSARTEGRAGERAEKEGVSAATGPAAAASRDGMNPWLSVALPLFLGLFVAYLDRINLSVALPALREALHIEGAVAASAALTAFLAAYAPANIIGGLLTRRFDPKTVVIACLLLWSGATLVTPWAGGLSALLLCRAVLGLAEGVYWPQQSRFARAWFPPAALSRANSLIQYYGQYAVLALGFLLLTPLYHTAGWPALFWATGLLGLLLLPLYGRLLPATPPGRGEMGTSEMGASGGRPRFGWQSVGGPSFLLLIFSYITQGMLFWGITLWIPPAVSRLGFTGPAQAGASALPYLAALLLAWPIARLADRSGRRVEIAALGLIGPGLLVAALPALASPALTLAFITLAMGWYAASYTPNLWAILQERVAPEAVGAAAGLINGFGAGGGGTLAGFLVGLIEARTGSYLAGFALLGALNLAGGAALLAYGRLTRGRMSRTGL